MNNHIVLKIAAILLLSEVMFLSAIAVIANTNPNKTTITSLGVDNNHKTSSREDVIWDNDLNYGEFLLPCQYEPTYGELGSCADDFIFESTKDVNDVHWIGGFWNGNPAPFDWQITFYNDDGSGIKPGSILTGPIIYPNAECNETFLEQVDSNYYYSWSVHLDEPITCIGGIKYWIGFQGQGVLPPQSGIAGHINPIKLNEMKFKSTFFGYPDWMDGYLIFGTRYDLAFQLTGQTSTEDYTPPVTVCKITGTTEKTIILTASDDLSGVDITKYKLDDSTWTNYTTAFVVSEIGNHVVYYYSVDKAGNVEVEKNKTFTVIPSTSIAIRGGLSITVTIKNTGITNLTNVPYTINLDGKLIFVGKSKNDTIASLGVGEEVKVKDFVIGFGKTGIAVTAGGAEASVEGTILLLFVLGIK